METTEYITRQDIVNFPFPYKLWIVIHLEICEFLRWNRDGTVILLDLVALEDYLNSTRSIFKIKNRSVFVEHLDEFNFERLNVMPEAEEDLVLQYKNENFQRHRLDLLAKIRRHTYQLIGEMPINKCENIDGGDRSGTTLNNAAGLNDQHTLGANNRVAERMFGDLCFMFHGGISKIHMSRLRFQTILNFQNETRTLQAKLKISEENLASQRRGKPDARSAGSGVFATEDVQVIELPVDLFENPHDSVLHLGEDFCSDYAGYYGNCSKDQIMQFFGDYLPMYEDSSMDVKKVAADKNIKKTINRNSLYSNGAIPSTQSYDPNTIKSSSVITSTPMAGQPNIHFNFSSGLEPIFKTEVLENGSNSPKVINEPLLNDSLDNDAEISMDEFITFKDSSNKSFTKMEMKEELNDINSCLNPSEEFCVQQTAAKDFSQMPAAVKMEIEEETVKNEANFRNFFSQYRASLNLLYDRQ